MFFFVFLISEEMLVLTYCLSCFLFEICVSAELQPRWSQARNVVLDGAGTSSSLLLELGLDY